MGPTTPFQSFEQQQANLDKTLGASPFQSSDEQLAELNRTLGVGAPTASEGFVRGQVEAGRLPREALSNPLYRAYIDQEEDPFEAVAKLNASKYFSDSLGMDFSAALSNYDNLSSAWFGSARSPMTAWEAIQDSYELGKYSFGLSNR